MIYSGHLRLPTCPWAGNTRDWKTYEPVMRLINISDIKAVEFLPPDNEFPPHSESCCTIHTSSAEALYCFLPLEEVHRRIEEKVQALQAAGQVPTLPALSFCDTSDGVPIKYSDDWRASAASSLRRLADRVETTPGTLISFRQHRPLRLGEDEKNLVHDGNERHDWAVEFPHEDGAPLTTLENPPTQKGNEDETS